MRKRRLFSSAILVVFVAASIVITACNGPNNPKPSGSNPETEKPAVQQLLKTDVFPKAPDGKTYDGYKITWTDAQGNVQTKTVTMDDVKNGVVLPGGVKEGTQPNVVPLVKNTDGTVTEDPNAGQNVTPSPSVDWKPSIQAGIAELEKEHPDFDAALAKFKDAYNAERNNTTKAYYAAAQLAYISVKPATVNFMRNKMGFATYPEKLNALVNLDWFKEYTMSYPQKRGLSVSTATFSLQSYGQYSRVNGHIADAPDSSKVSIPISSGYNLPIYEMGTFGELAGKWVELGYDALWKTINNTPVKNRKVRYGCDDLPYKGKYFIVDTFDGDGNFMVFSNDVQSMAGADIAQKYHWATQWIWCYYDAFHSYKMHSPEMQAAAEWYKNFDPVLQIPAYLIEHSNSANVDQLLDELYGILFGAEFTDASNLLNSLDATKPVTIDKKLIKVLHMDEGIFDADSDVELQKDQLLGIIGGLTVTKGAIELLQSYSFNTDLNILKWNWEKEAEALKDLGAYNAQQDPFNNGFLKGRSQQKIIDAKNNIVKGADLLLASYKSLTDSATLPADVKAKVKEHTEPIQRIVQEIRDAVDEARTATLLVGTHNPMKDEFQVFTIDMGKVFTYEYFELANLFEMNGTKPKIYPAGGTSSTPYMNLTVKRFMNDFVTIKLKDGREVFEDFKIPLDGTVGTKIINFYN